ncbi:hypothetical protein [Pedobacter cryoconitis]|uniref:hypothetical protein n=1 Tax=Pedobacter cryoconitis TaxID=188932 RepID=UPI001610D418|nr:hypothetical protein [Pedobacter cryoconitis]MBB5644060.1 phosphoribosyl-AMP cyclohydrolase [Pedobacter cryoconitis]
MKTYLLYLLTGFLLISNGCVPAANKKITIRALEFNSGKLKVVTSYANEKLNIMSMLYGNESALKYSIKGDHGHVAGEVFKLATFEQQDHELWYGSKINGALLRVETIRTVQQKEGITPLYTIEYYGTAKPDQPDKNARIKFILEQKASLFP